MTTAVLIPARSKRQRLRQRRPNGVMNNRPQLRIFGVPIPSDLVKSGHCAAYACKVLGEVDPDRPVCRACGRVRQFYDEHCFCGASKPWLFTQEASGGFDDLD